MLGGINQSRLVPYATHMPSPDVFTPQAQLLHIPSMQRYMAEDYVPGSGVIRLNDHADPFVFPNDYLNGDEKGVCYIPSTTGRVLVQFEKLGRHRDLILKWTSSELEDLFDAAEKSTWLAGHPVDFAATRFGQWINGSTNPAYWLVNELVIGGRHEGYPTGLHPDQRLKTQVFSGKRQVPAGNWTVMARGTGRLEFRIGHRNNPDVYEFPAIDFVDGVASGPLVIAEECSDLIVDLAASSFADPFHRMRIVMPGSWPSDLSSDGRGYEGKTFVQIYAEHDDDPDFYLPHPDHVRDGRNFRHARAVDQMSTIGYFNPGTYCGIVGPETRSKPGLGFGKQTFGYGGAVPWEWLVEDAALCRQDLYITVGHEWTDDTVLEFCEVFKEHAPSWMKLVVAHTCEPWNLFFNEYYACAIKGAARFHPRVIESLTYNSGTGKATATRKGHGYANGDTIQIHGTSEAAYNGPHAISGVTADTFQFTPAETPSHSPAEPQEWGGAPGSAFRVGEPGAFVVESIELQFSSGDANSGPYSGFLVTTTEPVVVNGNVVAICNVDGTGVDNYWMAIRHNGHAPNQFLISFQFQALHRPVLDATSAWKTYEPLPGRQIVGSVVLGYFNVPGREIAVQDAIGAWHGYRTGHIFKLIQSQFDGELSRLVAACEGFIFASYNEIVMRYFLAEFGGKLPPVSETTLHIATYADPTIDQRDAFVGDMKPLASISVSDGIATATVAAYPSGSESGPYVTSHGWSAGNQITIQAVSRVDCNGKFTILATPTASTFTFAAPNGVPDGLLSATVYGMFAIKDNTKGILIYGVSRSGTQLTLNAPGHPFANGQSVCLMGFNTFRTNGVFSVLSSTANSFTVNIPGFVFTPAMDLEGHAAAFDAALAPIMGQALESRLGDAEYISWLDSTREIAERIGGTWGTYETGTHPLAKNYVRHVPWVGGAIMAGMRDPAMHPMTVAQIALHESKDCRRFTFYSNTGPWSYDGNTFSAKEHQADALSRKWTGLVAGGSAYFEPRTAIMPATAFLLTVPAPVRFGEYAGYGSVGPDGALSVDTTVTLDDGGAGGDFDPPVLVFVAGSISAQPFIYNPPAAGTATISAASSPQLGEVPEVMSVTLDDDGNPGTATTIVDDDFNRANGPVGNGWISNAAESCTIAGNRMEMARSPSALFQPVSTICYRDGVNLIDGQVRIRFIAGSAAVGALFLSDGNIGNPANCYAVMLLPQSNRVQISRFLNSDGLFYNQGTQESFVPGEEYDLLAKCYGSSSTFDVHVFRVSTEEPIFEATSIPYTGMNPAITTPGKIGLVCNSDTAIVTRAKVSSLEQPDPEPVLTVTPATATSGSGTNTVMITATLVDSNASLSASVTGGGTLSTNQPVSGVGFTWTKPGTESGVSTISVVDTSDGLTDTCVITYSANSPVVKLSGWLKEV